MLSDLRLTDQAATCFSPRGHESFCNLTASRAWYRPPEIACIACQRSASHPVAYFRSSGRYLTQKTIVGMLFEIGIVLALSCQYMIVFSFFSLATSVAVSRTSQSEVFGST